MSTVCFMQLWYMEGFSSHELTNMATDVVSEEVWRTGVSF